METNNETPAPIRENEWDTPADWEGMEEEQIPEELIKVLQAADEAEQMREAQEEDYTPDWDGTDAEFIEDEDAAVYEEQYAGIKLSYSLTSEEALDCLKETHIFKTSGKRAVVETVILGIAAVLFLVSYLLYGAVFNLVMTFTSIAFGCAIWVIPKAELSRRAKEIADGKVIEVEIYPDEVVVGSGEGEWSIPLDGTSKFAEFDDLMVLFTPKNNMLAIPMRSMEPAVIADIQGMLAAGSIPKEP